MHIRGFFLYRSEGPGLAGDLEHGRAVETRAAWQKRIAGWQDVDTVELHVLNGLDPADLATLRGQLSGVLAAAGPARDPSDERSVLCVVDGPGCEEVEVDDGRARHRDLRFAAHPPFSVRGLVSHCSVHLDRVAWHQAYGDSGRLIYVSRQVGERGTQFGSGEHGLVGAGGAIAGTNVYGIREPFTHDVLGRHVVNDTSQSQRGFAAKTESWDWDGTAWPDYFELASAGADRAWDHGSGWVDLDHDWLPSGTTSSGAQGLSGGRWYDIDRIVSGQAPARAGYLWVDPQGTGGARWFGKPGELQSVQGTRRFAGLGGPLLAWRFSVRTGAPQGSFHVLHTDSA